MAYKSKYTGAEVDNLLSKADTALQQYEEKYKGTVTGININGVVKNPTDGIIDVGDIITSDDVYCLEISDISTESLILQNQFSKIRNCKILILKSSEITYIFTAQDNNVDGVELISFTGTFGDSNMSALFYPNEDGGATFELQAEPIYTFKSINGEEIFGEGNIEIEGGIQTETDPIFMASPAAGISQENIALWNNKVDSSTLSTVAISGNYNDLSNKPSIPDPVTESTISGWGFTKNSGTYSKPSTGIPKSDFASSVQTSLGKADTALQSYTEQYKGTVTGVKINGSTKSPSSGTVDIGNVATSVKINGQSKSPSSGVVDLGYINKQLSTSTSSSMTLSPNVYYRNTSTSLSTLTITLGSVSNSNILNEYFIEFTTRSSGTTVSLPSSVKWANGETPTFEASTTYQISIVNNLGVVTKFK